MNTEMLGMGVGDVECLLRVPHHPLPPPPKKTMSAILALEMWRQKEQGFRVILGKHRELEPAWIVCAPSPKKRTERKYRRQSKWRTL